MPLELDDLYRLKKKDIKRASFHLAKAFHNDPGWVYLIPDEKERLEKLPIAFKVLLIDSIKYGEVYAPSENLEGVTVWSATEQTLWRTIRSGAFLTGIKLGSKTGGKLSRVFGLIDKDRKESMKNRSYIYLQAIGVLPKFQRQGFGRVLLRTMFERADDECIPIYLETETEINVTIYRKYGFTVIKEGKLAGYDFYLWEMLREPQ